MSENRIDFDLSQFVLLTQDYNSLEKFKTEDFTYVQDQKTFNTFVSQVNTKTKSSLNSSDILKDLNDEGGTLVSSKDLNLIETLQMQMNASHINILLDEDQAYCVQVFCVLLHELASIASRDAFYVGLPEVEVYNNYVLEKIGKLHGTSIQAIKTHLQVVKTMMGQETHDIFIKHFKHLQEFNHLSGPATSAGGGSKKKPRVPAH